MCVNPYEFHIDQKYPARDGKSTLLGDVAGSFAPRKHLLNPISADRRRRDFKNVNRSWSGFLPQNEIVRLQWAALEFQNAELLLQQVEHLKKLAGSEGTMSEEETVNLKVLRALDAYLRKPK
jgi:hypothetical protein